jgi:glycerol uptake facilitator-like aquaporin
MAKATTRSSEMNVYTALMVVTALLLIVGVGVLVMSNMKQAETGNQPGSPLTVVK